MCPLENCDAQVKDLSRHLNKFHKIVDKFDRKKITMMNKKVKPKNAENREAKLCPFCQVSYIRLDSHLRSAHKMDSESYEYRSLFKKREVREKETNQTSKKSYSDYAISMSGGFNEWLKTPSGGGKSVEDAKKTAYKVRQILTEFNQSDIELLGRQVLESEEELKLEKRNLLSKLEEWFIDYSCRNSAISAKTYLFAFKSFLKYLLLREDYPFHSENMVKYTSLFECWLQFLSKRSAQQKADKLPVEVTTEQVRSYESSQDYLSVKEDLLSLNEKQSGTGVQSKYRSFLLVNFLLHNGSRPCAIANISQKEFHDAQCIEENGETSYVIFVADHKTIASHGKAKITIPKWLHNAALKYEKYVRPEQSQTYEFAGREIVRFFLSSLGTKINSDSILKALQTAWKKAGFDIKIVSMDIRRLCVTSIHEVGDTSEKSRCAEHLAHSVNTASTYYKEIRRANKAANDGRLCHSAINGDIFLQNKTEQQTFDDPPPSCSHEPPIKRKKKENVHTNDSDYEPSSSEDDSVKKPLRSAPTKQKQRMHDEITSDYFSTNKSGRGNPSFSEQNRSTIKSAFFNFIYDQKTKPNPPPAKVIRRIIEDKNLDLLLGEKCTIPKIKGCIMGLIKKEYGYK